MYFSLTNIFKLCTFDSCMNIFRLSKTPANLQRLKSCGKSETAFIIQNAAEKPNGF